MELLTPRLRLRSFRESDLDAYAEMCADPEVAEFLGGPLDRVESWRHMAMILGHWQLRGFGLWAAELRASGELVGRLGCWRPEGWPALEVGWSLARKFWGQGLAHEGAEASLRFAFENLAVDRVVSLIHPKNVRSIALAERLGERPVGEAEVRGHRLTVYALEAEAWRARPRPTSP
ncbi:MAG TPA: GNAT family N-acetyltransferase [Thermoanaerobaculia bacterium]|nr:GNAT family N-acetyltransferase [Thermoanaerobaculia bacterium]